MDLKGQTEDICTHADIIKSRIHFFLLYSLVASIHEIELKFYKHAIDKNLIGILYSGHFSETLEPPRQQFLLCLTPLSKGIKRLSKVKREVCQTLCF